MFLRIFTKIALFLCCLSFLQINFGQNDSLVSESFLNKKTVEKIPVVPFYDTLFFINMNIGSFSAEQRAESITEKIKKIGKERGFHEDSLKVVVLDNFTEIVYKDMVIMGITPADAYATGEDLISLSHENKKIICEAIIDYKQKNDWRYILIHVSLALLVVVALFFAFKLVNWIFRSIEKYVEKLKEIKLKNVKQKSFNLLDESRLTKLILLGIKIVRILVIIVLCYFAITMLFSVFPPTRGIADKLFGFILHPLQKIWKSIGNYIPNLITLIIIVLVFRYLIKILRVLAGEIHKGRFKIKGFYSDWALPTFSIIRILMYVFMFILIFPYLPGSDTSIFKGVSVFIGAVFTLGSSSIINNVVSGFVITYMRPFKIGDRIKIGDIVGNVIEKTPFVTRIRTPKNEEVTVPNSTIMAAQTFNYTNSAKENKLILHTKVTFGYDVPWRQVHQLLLDAAARTANVLKEPKPFVLQTALDDFYAEYQINIYIHDANKMPAIYSELNQHIQDVFHEAGIELVVPHYAAQRDGNHTTLPEEYIPKDYQTPVFKMKVDKDK